MMARRVFTPTEDDMIRQAHASQIHMRDLAVKLGASYGSIYRRMEELDLPRRKPDPRRWRTAA